MDRQELLSALRNLKSYYYKLGVTKTQLEQKSDAQNTARKNCSNARPRHLSLQDSLPDIYNVPEDAKNLRLYDEKNRPQMVQMLPTNKTPDISQEKYGGLSGLWRCVRNVLVALILLIVVLAAAFQNETIQKIYEENDQSGLILYGVFVLTLLITFIISSVRWLIIPEIKRKKCEKENRAADAINQKNIMKYKASVTEYELNHKSERQREYQKDIECSIRAYEKDTIKYNSYISSQKQIISKLDDEIKQCRQKIEDIEICINNDNTLPTAYKNEKTIDKIIEYLENFRADSLKEAINLYEYETAMEKHNSSMRRAAWESALQAGRQADAMRETAEHQAQLAYEAQRQRQAAEKAAESARKAAESNEEALNIIKEWDKNSN